MRICGNCYRRHWRAKINKSTGLQVKHQNGNLIYVCIYCGHVQEEEHEFIPPDKRIQANILYIDLETSKSMYYNYGSKVPSKYLRSDDLIHEWFMISWSASYVGNNKVWSQIVTPEKAVEWDDSEIVQRLWDLMNAAEIIAGHNVNGFDLKRCNTRFVKHGLPPIVGKKTIDTLYLCRLRLALESNKLDDVEKWMGIAGKEHIDNHDWLMALQGDQKTLDKILHYNKGDVTGGKAVLEKLLPIANKKFNFGSLKKSTNDGEVL
jgi:DNA polymerase elongation subunit (family B)